MNLLEALFETVTEPAPPLHVGEAMNLWTIKAALEQTRPLLEGLTNQAEDAELKAFMEHARKDAHERHDQQVTAFMTEHRIPFPPAGSGKPHADPREIPPGVKLTDDEIANAMVATLLGAVSVVHASLTESVRKDLISMLLDMHQELLRLNFALQVLMRKKGWLRVPPPYHPTPAS